ncbi:NAD(P)/FAD-dependent oxidoreductase [Flaviaesturariibacter aridisoli]|uniref:FAD-binding oxidoreductase n=1 Tax=Flaviaesturariibacter aridisoli TaxID=2545761 RepID=A0A4R4DV75_9BACT|nr:FAD-binding oxidoreductase [Flaviaesturariibacter aridisoli]TCZ67318.1 FAD-binding oxidoreductase [Flaviaesturariibacter aridisoli]
MNVDYLIVGQGIAGSLLASFLLREGKSVLVIDNGADAVASKVAAGIINPVTGRRYHTTWKAAELHAFALKTYTELGEQLGSEYIYRKDIIEFFPTPDARNLFVELARDGNPYMSAYSDQNRFNDTLRYDFGCGQIAPAYVTNLPLLLADVRRMLVQTQSLLAEDFRSDDLELSGDRVRYGNISAEKIFFCDGAAGAANPWFRMLPFALNKGEALVIECRDLPADHIYKKGFLLAPLPVQHTFWAGSSYAWNDLDSGPTEAFRTRTTALLEGLLHLPFTVLQHKAAVRPATVERRPFVGLHPTHPQIGIFNGLGTKGTSLAPYFAQQLVHHLLHDAPLTPEANVQRFSRLLSR